MIATAASRAVDDREGVLNQALLYPLRFEPIYQYRLWGGRHLASLLTTPLPSGPVGEAWLLSDRDDHQSRVADGPLKGRTIGQLLQEFPQQIMGKLAGRFPRFPLLLKFLDVHEMLSVQVHPTKANTNLLPAGETPKTEAWVVLEAGTQSRIYAGLKPETTEADLRRSLTNGTVADQLACLTPKPGDAVFLRAGTVHSLGGDLVVFEIQQNSDVTFRLYDWDHVDPKTGKPRALQVDKAMACIDFSEGPVGRVTPVVETTTPVERERLFHCEHFWLWRLRGQSPFTVGAADLPRVLVCLQGEGQLEHGGATYAAGKGDVFVLPASIGTCVFRPRGAVNLLEIAIPDSGRDNLDGGGIVKKLIVFDLDGTLATSKSAVDPEMAGLLHDLLAIVKVAVISGGDWPQFEKQLISNLPHDKLLANLSILPTCGTKFYRYESEDWKKIYSEDFTADQREKILGSLKKAIGVADFKIEKLWGKQIEDRGSQITFSALGQHAPLDEKEKWDPDFAKRKKIKAILDGFIPEFSVRIGGSTSVDITKPGIDKAYGIGKLRDLLGISIKEMIYVGDALYVGGNDYPAKTAGVDCIAVKNPNETKRVIQTMIACLAVGSQAA